MATKPMTKALVPPGTEPTLEKMLNDALPVLQKVAPKYVNLTRMVSLAVEAKMRNPLLAKCSPVSVLNFCMRCAETGTDRIGAGGMWAVPFANKTGGYDMVPIPDWRLLVEKAKRAKAITHAFGALAHANDTFRYQLGDSPSLHHEPALGDRGEIIAAYCVATLPDGDKHIEVMGKAEIDSIRKRSKAANAGPWVSDYGQMAVKTVVKRCLKLFEGASIELSALLETDNAATGFVDLAIDREPVTMPTRVQAEEPETEPPAAPEPPAEAPVAPKAAISTEEKVKALHEDLIKHCGDVESVDAFCRSATTDSEHEVPDWKGALLDKDARIIIRRVLKTEAAHGR